MSKFFRIIAGLVVSAFCIWLAFRKMAWSDLWLGVSQAQWVWFFPMTAVYMGAHILRCFRWSFLLSPIKKVSPLTLFPVLMFGFLVNNILPGRMGEVARAYVAGRKNKIPAGTVLGSIAMERLTDLIGLGCVMLIALLVLPTDKLPILKVLTVLSSGFLTIGIIFFIARKAHLEGRFKVDSFMGKAMNFINQLINGFSSLRSPFVLAAVTFLSISIWMIEALTLMIGSRSFGLNLHFAQSNALLAGISVGVMIPASPGFIGTYEFFGKEMLNLLGYASGLSLPFLLSYHFYQMLLCSVLGLPVLIKFGMPTNHD